MAVQVSNGKRSRYIADAGLKVLAKSGDGAANDPGVLTGLLASYGTIDHDGEVIRAGCFAKSLAAKLASGGVPLMRRHFADGGDASECIGTITAAHEDATGLVVDAAPFSADAESQNMRVRIVGKHVRSMSVGFWPGTYEVRPPANDEEKAALARIGRTEVVEWIECELAEGTVTCRPCNTNAQITEAKSRTGESYVALWDKRFDVESKARRLRLAQL